MDPFFNTFAQRVWRETQGTQKRRRFFSSEIVERVGLAAEPVELVFRVLVLVGLHLLGRGILDVRTRNTESAASIVSGRTLRTMSAAVTFFCQLSFEHLGTQ